MRQNQKIDILCAERAFMGKQEDFSRRGAKGAERSNILESLDKKQPKRTKSIPPTAPLRENKYKSRADNKFL